MGAPLPNAPWALAQLVPSPEISFDAAGAHAGMRWQVTPVLYSFGSRAEVSRWRAFIAEPFVRHVGSIELSANPEYLAGDFSVRAGPRAYFPLIDHGEYLSCSIGTSLSTIGGLSVGYEAGVYVLYGILGVQLTLSPSPNAPPAIAALRFRFF